jgi:hypothetical protein
MLISLKVFYVGARGARPPVARQCSIAPDAFPENIFQRVDLAK